MPLYIYKAKDSQGRITKGKVEAPSETLAAEILAEKGLDLLVLSKSEKMNLFQWLEKKINRISNYLCKNR